jgi:hypothetical protein
VCAGAKTTMNQQILDCLTKANEPPGQHDLVREWFYGKAIRLINIARQQGTDVQNVEELHVYTQYQTLRNSVQTSLSSRVVSLMVFEQESTRPKLDQITLIDEISGAYLLNWQQFTIEKLLGGRFDLNTEQHQDDMFLQCARYLQPVALTIHEQLFGNILNHDPERYMSMYQTHFSLLGQPHVRTIYSILTQIVI